MVEDKAEEVEDGDSRFMGQLNSDKTRYDDGVGYWCFILRFSSNATDLPTVKEEEVVACEPTVD